jgi:hypothetical protein
VSVEARLEVVVEAPVEQTWAAATDWDQQGEWMLGTSVRGTARDGQGVGGGVEAFTGLGRLGFLDTMEITVWDPPHRCGVLHAGRVVRGTGLFEVRALGEGRSVFTWSEQLDLPLGLLGRAGWPVVRPLFLAGVKRSLDRFALWVPSR